MFSRCKFSYIYIADGNILLEWGKEMLKRFKIDETTNCSSFATKQGAEEFYFTITTGEGSSIEMALSCLHEKYLSACKQLGLSEDTIVFCRFYVSDIANQKDTILHSPLFHHVRHGAVSIIQQNPLTRDAVALFVYHMKKNNGVNFPREITSHRSDLWRTGLNIKGDNYSMVWTTNYSGFGALDSKQQTASLFESFSGYLHRQGVSVRDNLVRTWVYVRDIDNNYGGMVEARKEFFQTQGLTKDTRYVASTGIEGKAADTGALVTMDSLSFGNIKEEQIVTMNALENLSPTIVYGVTFERGLRVKFGDRSHLYISGTASIDKDGKILHAGDVDKQTLRTIENIEALLCKQNATFKDMAYVLCYIRNPKHFESVFDILKSRLPGDMPIIISEGAVCRPGWLFEMEGVGIIDDANSFPSFM
jgi:enamine deaminase RidA (YjgF/YER057c/UK114 family)